jgi:hypothetical protein
MCAAHDNNQTILGDSELSAERLVFYGENRLVLQAVDPEIVHAYWEVSMQDRCRLHVGYGGHFVIRMYNIDARTKEEYWFPEEITNCFIAVKNTGATYRGELGIYDKTRYHCLAISNPIKTPNGSIDGTPAQPVQNPEEQKNGGSTAAKTQSKKDLYRLLNLDEATVELDFDTNGGSGTVTQLSAKLDNANNHWHSSPHR